MSFMHWSRDTRGTRNQSDLLSQGKLLVSILEVRGHTSLRAIFRTRAHRNASTLFSLISLIQRVLTSLLLFVPSVPCFLTSGKKGLLRLNNTYCKPFTAYQYLRIFSHLSSPPPWSPSKSPTSGWPPIPHPISLHRIRKQNIFTHFLHGKKWVN